MKNLYTLTKKEKKITYLLCEKGIGISQKEILAKTLNISKTTLNTHLRNIFDKLNVHTLAELVYKYYQNKGEIYEKQIN